MIRPFLTVLETVFLLIAVSILIFISMGLMPGDPVDMMLAGNPNATPEDAARLKAIHGLDQPLFGRYLAWVGNLLTGDLGYSRLYSLPVFDVLLPALLQTLILLGAALCVALVIALPLGTWAAHRPGGEGDVTIRAFVFTGQSIPPFWLALMLILIFAVSLQWLPAGGLEDWTGWILPVIALALPMVAAYTRHIRSAILEVKNAQHVLTARAKGVRPAFVFFRHILPGAMPPIVTIIALDLGTLMGGAIVTETVFNLRGTGRMIYDAIIGNDFNLALSGLMLVTICVILANRVADMLYPLLDPRLR